MEVSVVHLLKKENRVLSGHILPLPETHKRCLKNFGTQCLMCVCFERNREEKIMPVLLLNLCYQVLLFHHQKIRSYNPIAFKVLRQIHYLWLP